MHTVSKTVRQFIELMPNVKRVVLAYSGGVDSTVLLHAAVKAELGLPVLAIHINHQLSKHADEWQEHCAQICRNLEVPSECLKVNVDPAQGGVEQAARDARLRVFSDMLLEGDVLLMAHHQQDQLETFFLRLARGAGLRGLSGMPKVRRLGRGFLARPLLGTGKADIEQYAKRNNMTWVEDESNTSLVFDRNFLRLQVLPSIQERWHTFASQVSRAAFILQENEALLSEYTAQDLNSLHPKEERVGCSIPLLPLLQWSIPRRNAVIRQWLLNLNYRSPSQKQLAEFETLAKAGVDKRPLLNWVDCELRRYKERIYCLPTGWQEALNSAVGESISKPLLLGVPKAVLGCGVITLKGADFGLRVGPSYRVVSIGSSETPLRGHPAHREHSQKLKKLIQEYQLEPWLRDFIPLIMDGERLAAVGDLWVEANYHAELVSCMVKWELVGTSII